MADLVKLKQAAEAASAEGAWKANESMVRARQSRSTTWIAECRESRFAAFIASGSPEVVMALVDVSQAAKAYMHALDVLETRPTGEFTGEELPAVDAAAAALRSSLEKLERV